VNAADFVCTWCERVHPTGGDWHGAWPEELRLSRAPAGICPECLAHETRAALTGGIVLSLAVDDR
jgi:hypothetical protein